MEFSSAWRPQPLAVRTRVSWQRLHPARPAVDASPCSAGAMPLHTLRAEGSAAAHDGGSLPQTLHHSCLHCARPSLHPRPERLCLSTAATLASPPALLLRCNTVDGNLASGSASAQVASPLGPAVQSRPSAKTEVVAPGRARLAPSRWPVAQQPALTGRPFSRCAHVGWRIRQVRGQPAASCMRPCFLGPHAPLGGQHLSSML